MSASITAERTVARESDRSYLYDVMSWIKRRMMDAVRLWDEGKLPLALYMPIHLFWWSIGMAVVSVCAGAIALAEAPAKIRERISHRGARA